MSSSARRAGRVIRGAAAEGDVFVLGESRPGGVAAPAPVATAQALLEAARAQAEQVLKEARAAAASLVAKARAEVMSLEAEARERGRREGYEAGRAAAEAEFAAHLELMRSAAVAGKEARDTIAASADAVVARAVLLAARRLVGEYYEGDPARTAAICREALRAASGQEVLTVRVNPAVAGDVRVALADLAEYVQPDAAVAIGGCLVDLRHGTIDATLDARLSLLEVALARAAGGAG